MGRRPPFLTALASLQDSLTYILMQLWAFTRVSDPRKSKEEATMPFVTHS